MVKLTVLPQPHAKFSLGVMALPHRIDALKNHDLSNVSQIPRGTRKGAVSAGYLFFDCCAVLLLYCIVLYCIVMYCLTLWFVQVQFYLRLFDTQPTLHVHRSMMHFYNETWYVFIGHVAALCSPCRGFSCFCRGPGWSPTHFAHNVGLLLPTWTESKTSEANRCGTVQTLNFWKWQNLKSWNSAVERVLTVGNEVFFGGS